MRSSDRKTGHLSARLQIVHGYLDETLEAATVSSGELDVKTATMSIWAFDATDTWADTGANIELTNLDEGDDYAAKTRVVAYWDERLKLWFPLDVSCSPSALPIGGS